MIRSLNCFEAIGELDSAMADVVPAGIDYLVLGGIASSALRHPDTKLDPFPVGGMVCAPDSAAESVIRDNGTRRDIDILLTGVLDEETSQKIKETVTDATDGQLLVSIFDFDKHDPDPSLLAKVKAGVSHRTIDEEGTLRYELYPLSQIVSAETYSPWQLMTPSGLRVNVLNPAGHALAYRMRSISGTRIKDAEKVSEMTKNVMAVPELRQAIYEGAFLDWLAFAEAIPRILRKQMDRDDGMLIPETSRAALAAFRWKGKLLQKLESQDFIVKLAQDENGPVQKALNFFVSAK
jgi:hypothetical protein